MAQTTQTSGIAPFRASTNRHVMPAGWRADEREAIGGRGRGPDRHPRRRHGVPPAERGHHDGALPHSTTTREVGSTTDDPDQTAPERGRQGGPSIIKWIRFWIH